MGVLWECLGGQEDEGEDDEYMSHKVSYKWIRRTQVIPEYVVFYNKGKFGGKRFTFNPFSVTNIVLVLYK